MSTRFQMPVAVHLLLRREKKILLSLRQGTGYEDGKYSLIAGHLNGKEPTTKAMIREAKEEAGIHIKDEWLEPVCVMHRKSLERESIDFFYSCQRWEGDIKNMEPKKCGGLHFFPEDEIPENTIGYIRTGIQASRNGTQYVEFGW